MDRERDIDEFSAALGAYQRKFEDTPTVFGLPVDARDQAIDLLQEAVKRGKPFKDDAEWFAALGLEPPPEDADI